MTLLAPGQVRQVWINHDRLDTTSERKRRPGVLVTPGRMPHRWVVMGLTTLANYADRSPRQLLVDGPVSGLHRATYLWGRNPVVLPLDDIDGLVGLVTERDAQQIVAMFRRLLTADEVAGFLAGATAAWPAYEAPVDDGTDIFAGLPA